MKGNYQFIKNTLVEACKTMQKINAKYFVCKRQIGVVGLFFVIIILCYSKAVSAQYDSLNVRSDVYPNGGNLNHAIDSVSQTGRLSKTIFCLQPNSIYILTATIHIPQGEHLTIVAPPPGNTPETSPPQILWTASPHIDKRYIFNCFGDISLKNIWLYYADTNGKQIHSTLQIQDDSVANKNGKGEIGYFEGIIFDYSGCPENGSGAVGIAAKHFRGSFKNCYFRNCVDSHLTYFGRAISFPYDEQGWHIDSLYFENCTFANLGYVYLQQKGNYADQVLFNHCTFFNIIMPSLGSGWWYELSITNSIWVNTAMYGDIPYLHDFGFETQSGTIQIDRVAHFGFDVPFNDHDRRILFAYNAYFMEPWLIDWMSSNPYSTSCRQRNQPLLIPVPQPMLNDKSRAFFESPEFPLINRVCVYEEIDPCFKNPPTNFEALKTFLYFKWSSEQDTNWAYNPAASTQRLWPLPEDLSYTNQFILTAGMGGFPLGDLYHWFPEEYYNWKGQQTNENERISTWLTTGHDTGTARNESTGCNNSGLCFFLQQNYPNPLNATTQITYSIPKNDHVSLRLYNVRGEEVAKLFDGFQMAGRYKIIFDASFLANGIYVYQLRTNHGLASRRLVLLK